MTKEIPKEMLPIATYQEGVMFLKPMLQLIFEHLFEKGFREFCIITGRGKRSIEDHFSPDWSLVENVGKNSGSGKSLAEFFRMIEESRIYFLNQSKRRGFGDAVLQAENFVGGDPFLVHAGDDFITSTGSSSYVSRLFKVYEEHSPDAVLLSERSLTPEKFGVIMGEQISPGLHHVRTIIEKPKIPPTNLTVIAVYIFKPAIFTTLKTTFPDDKGEIQLTTGIQKLIETGHRVLSSELVPNEKRIEIGTPNSYIDSLLATMDTKTTT